MYLAKDSYYNFVLMSFTSQRTQTTPEELPGEATLLNWYALERIPNDKQWKKGDPAVEA